MSALRDDLPEINEVLALFGLQVRPVVRTDPPGRLTWQVCWTATGQPVAPVFCDRCGGRIAADGEPLVHSPGICHP